MTTIKNSNDWKKLLNKINSDNFDLVYEIASYYDHGFEIDGLTIVPQNQKEAFQLYKKASENGHIYATTRLADFYSEGIECEKNIDLAIQLYEKSVLNGNGIAAQNLATVYRDLEDFQKAFEL